MPDEKRVDMSQDRSADLEWIRFREDTLGKDLYPEEVATNRFSRKMWENPVVPIGCIATMSALSYGLWAFRQGKMRQSQVMMRVRVGAQGFTIMAILVGVLATGTSK